MRSTAWSSRCRKASTKGFVRGGCGFCALKQEKRPRFDPGGRCFCLCLSAPPCPRARPGAYSQVRRHGDGVGRGERRSPVQTTPRSGEDKGEWPPGRARGYGVFGCMVSLMSPAMPPSGTESGPSGQAGGIRRFECVTTPLTLFAFPRPDRGIQGRLAEAGVGCP